MLGYFPLFTIFYINFIHFLKMFSLLILLPGTALVVQGLLFPFTRDSNSRVNLPPKSSINISPSREGMSSTRKFRSVTDITRDSARLSPQSRALAARVEARFFFGLVGKVFLVCGLDYSGCGCSGFLRKNPRRARVTRTTSAEPSTFNTHLGLGFTRRT